jgi:preprotein translocase subunit SecF
MAKNKDGNQILNLMKRRVLYFMISGVFLIPGLFALVVWGLRPGIDFTGGSLLELEFIGQEVEPKQVAELLAGSYELESVQRSGENGVMIRGKAMDNQQKEELVGQLQVALSGEANEVEVTEIEDIVAEEDAEVVEEPSLQIEELRFETVGPVLGRELLQKTLMAVAVVAILITIYVAYQFKELKYGVCAILAMFHDSLILLGSFALLGHFYGVEVDILFVTAVLTTLSFSIHDTIVVFDRIRELKRQHGRVDFETVVNSAVIETLSRSINNSITIIVMLLALVMVGGESLKMFALALLIGAITGTYSSTFTAAPLLLVWEQVSRWNKLRKRRR